MKSVKTVQSYPSRIEADIAKGLLRSNGIEATVVADDVGGLYPVTLSDGVRLNVDQQDAVKAKKILQANIW